jgi:hypothetical protein
VALVIVKENKYTWSVWKMRGKILRRRQECFEKTVAIPVSVRYCYNLDFTVSVLPARTVHRKKTIMFNTLIGGKRLMYVNRWDLMKACIAIPRKAREIDQRGFERLQRIIAPVQVEPVQCV